MLKKICEILIIIISFTTLILLIDIRIAMEKWGSEFMMHKVTTIEQNHYYEVQSYGVIKLNDRLVGIDYIRESPEKP